MFGDEREDYGASLQRYYANGPAPDWPERFVTAYASSHPWEDFAETWAHYFHMVDTLETAFAFGLRLRPKVAKGADLSAAIDFDPYIAEMDRIIDAWLPLTFAVNSINRSMGQQDLYPFVLPPAVIWKLTFIHDQIHAAGALRLPGSGDNALRAIVAGLRRSVGSPRIHELIGFCNGSSRRSGCSRLDRDRGSAHGGITAMAGPPAAQKLHRKLPIYIGHPSATEERMSILVSLHHVTRYHYDRPVGLGPQVIRLRPAPHCRTRVVSYALKVAPAQHFVNWQQDPNGNWLARYVFPEKTREFTIAVDLIADMAVVNPFDFFVEPFAEIFPFAYPAEFAEELAPYLYADPAGPGLSAFLASIPRNRQNTVDFLVELNQRLQREIRYLIRMETGVQTPEQTLVARSGSCRDSAWLLVQILRRLGLAARFVSGYLIQLRPDVRPLDGPGGTVQDFTDLHAWTEVYVPGAGWIGLDATSGLLCGEGHLPLAATPHFRAAAPISGAVEAAEVTFSFDMAVTRIAEKPRVTYPFSDDAWAELDALGEKVDHDLAEHDVRLTMGGEPTFVSIDDYQAAEWNTAALGPTKRIRADDLIRRLRDRYAPGGLLHYGQGKWYPGEALPRWAFALHWRRDGKPVWRNAALVATETGAYRPLADDAERFAQSVAARLGLDADYVQPAFEDPAERMLKQGALPENVDPGDPKIDDPVERDRIMRAFERHLGVPAGYVLPVQRWTAQAAPGWVSEVWQTRRRRLFLTPGDSPIGFRLPLSSLPDLKAVDYPHLVPADPMEIRGELPDPELIAQAIAHRSESVAARAKVVEFRRAQGAPARVIASPSGSSVPVRTALTVEPRDGRLCVFMPPVERLEDYLELLATVEATAAELNMQVHVEGYEPPRGPALECHQGDARSRRDRGQCPSRRELARGGRAHAHALRGNASLPPRYRQVHDRRTPHRNRRWQSHRARRADRG